MIISSLTHKISFETLNTLLVTLQLAGEAEID